jgi:hypothetical protein
MKASHYSRVPLCAELPHARPLAYYRIAKRAFERVHAVPFRSIATRLLREFPTAY